MCGHPYFEVHAFSSHKYTLVLPLAEVNWTVECVAVPRTHKSRPIHSLEKCVEQVHLEHAWQLGNFQLEPY